MKRTLTAILCLWVLLPAMRAEETLNTVIVSTQETVKEITVSQTVAFRVSVENEIDDGLKVAIELINKDYSKDYPMIVFKDPFTKDDFELIKKEQKFEIKTKGALYEDFRNKKIKAPIAHAHYLTTGSTTRWTLLSNPFEAIAEPDESAKLGSVQMCYGDTVMVIIPVHLMESKSDFLKRKGTLFQWENHDLQIIAQGQRKPKVDPVLNDFRTQLEKQQAKLKTAKFCTSREHKPNPKDAFIGDLDKLRTRVEAVMNSLSSRDRNEYQKVIDEIDSCKNIVEGSSHDYVCSKHGFPPPPPPYKCRACHDKVCNGNKTTVAKKMQSLAEKVGRKVEASQADISQANTLKNCAVALKAFSGSIKTNYDYIIGKRGGHKCGVCNGNKTTVVKKMQSLAEKVGRKAKASQADINQAATLKNCAVALKAFSGSITTNYNNIMKKK